ncbi:MULTISPECIES: methionine adenosyltransferase [Mobiluncus]|uniref:S-adenosylmethionine synthase n=3 Tax=Mobiluncus TaxID=2050 RepID=D6ZHB7_MOBCV|nr:MULTISPECIES: methionine adenosyltransferase [Mobiluncus]ADI68025.1 methionine adenosyltransferase [Mobiluncus curtisii ATCC 43063]EFL94508.1 methionine adenosyltransferase [Mobiluncus curtisii subsp. curtisii ATCC 35241]EFU82268.1 methionine adenosyltransferase [Mobiluncus holmesii ATCC 35242]MCU9987401.1 methionine adenosyltransferase [Mobiluncus curtisii]MCV0000531.1 methionine adenosyltransferase [Mobiluncus curtisii]
MSKKVTFTSESVTEGHPDKVCDRIADSILDAILEQDPAAHVAVETFVTTGLVHVMGEVTTEAYVEIPHIVRHEIAQIGYTSSDIGFDGRSCGVMVSLGQQSPDIEAGVSHSLEVRQRPEAYDPLDEQGAGDQGIMFGYACDETPDLMPMPIWLAHKLSQRLAQVRKEGIVSGLRPDGKTQVSIEYEDGVPRALSTVVVSTQHAPDRTQAELHAMVEAEVIRPVLDQLNIELDTKNAEILVNPSGQFIIGGPAADSGLTGRKIIVDTYGGMARHGGGAFSGKDASKVDRSASYALRWITKNIVAAGLAKRCEIQIAYAIGRANPVSLSVETFGTGVVSDEELAAAIRETFDLRPAAIIRDLDLTRPIFRYTSNYGHFGRDGFSWEETNRAQALKDYFQ